MTDFKDRPEPAVSEDESGGQGGLRRRLSGPLRFLGGRFGFLGLGLLILACLVYLVASADSFMKSGELEREIQRLNAEIETMEDDNRLLRQKLERIQNDPAYIEDEARKKTGMIRPGEIIYRLSEEPDLTDDPPPPPPGLP